MKKRERNERNERKMKKGLECERRVNIMPLGGDVLENEKYSFP